MKWLDIARTRLRLLFARRAAESRMHTEIGFHIAMEAEQLVRTKGLSPDEARRQALLAFGGVETHKDALRHGRGLAWLGGMALDVKLGGRMLLKYPGLTFVGGLALAIAIGIGAGWYDLTGKISAPAIPLPEGDRLVVIETQNVQTNAPEPRVLSDFLEWRRELRAIEDLGAYRSATRNLIVGNEAPEAIWMAEITAGAFGAARVPPLLGRALLDSDEMPGAPRVVVLGHDVWQRSLEGRHDVIGLVVNLGDTTATVIGVMPKNFAYPINYAAWTPLSLHPSYGALEGGPIGVIGRLAPGVTRAQAAAELRVLGERAAAALPATHQHLEPRVLRLGESPDTADLGVAVFAIRNLPALLVLAIACLSVGTLVYARTAIREGEIVVRSALGASRARILGQIFVETLVLTAPAAAAGLLAADRVLRWALEQFTDAPFWMTPGLKPSTMVYAGGLAVVSAAILSLLPALKVTRPRLQPHLASRGATLRFGRVWTGAMIVQVALTAMGMPAAMETASEARRTLDMRTAFPNRAHVAAAQVDLDRPLGEESATAFEEQRARVVTALLERLAQEPGVAAVTFADHVPGVGAGRRFGQVERSPGAGSVYEGDFSLLAVGPGFFDTFERAMVAGRSFHTGDWHPAARTAIVNEAFARAFMHEAGSLPIGARLRYRGPYRGTRDVLDAAPGSMAIDTEFEIVGVARDFGLNPNDYGDEPPYVFHAASAATVSPLVVSMRVHDDADALAARLPALAASVDQRLLVRQAQSLDAWLRSRENHLAFAAGAWAAVIALILFLSALSLFSLVSVTVSRQTREIGLRAALGAQPRHVLGGVLSRAAMLMGSGIIAGGALLLLIVAIRDSRDVALYAWFLAATAAVMLTACLLACLVPAQRALRINPSDALRET